MAQIYERMCQEVCFIRFHYIYSGPAPRYIAENAGKILKVTKTTKIHIILEHVIPFVEHTLTPLAQYSEQELENNHHTFPTVGYTTL